MINRLGLTFDLASDPNQRIIKAFRVQNPDTAELAIHAVYIVNKAGEVIYRKVGRRRPVSAELIDAVDAYRGEYPTNDRRVGRPERRVAYPSNNFQTLIEMSVTPDLPTSIGHEALQPVLDLIEAGQSSDDVLIAFRRFVAEWTRVPQEDLLDAANWLARQRFIADKPEAIAAGQDLQRRLRRLAELESRLEHSTNDAEKDVLLHRVAAARGGLTKARATVRNHAADWQLRYAQGALRGYREVARERP